MKLEFRDYDPETTNTIWYSNSPYEQGDLYDDLSDEEIFYEQLWARKSELYKSSCNLRTLQARQACANSNATPDAELTEFDRQVQACVRENRLLTREIKELIKSLSIYGHSDDDDDCLRLFPIGNDRVSLI